MLAGFAYCLYCHDLFGALEKSGFGLRIKGEFAGLIGFSDDDILLAPSALALQEMINITKKYCDDHGPAFSTDPNPSKSKTKCISWLRWKRDLPDIFLWENCLPWVDRIKQLGNVITNGDRVLEEDMAQKKAKYINRNCELNQEFHFAGIETKLLVKDLYNCSV